MIDVKELRVGNVLYVKYESKTHIVHSIHEYKTFNGGYAIRMENGFKWQFGLRRACSTYGRIAFKVWF